MDQFLTNRRNPILFPETAEDFANNVKALKVELKTLIADNPAGRDFYLETAVGVAIDLRSYLAEWKLVDLVKKEDIEAASDELLAFAEASGAAEAVAEARKEIASIAASATKKMCDMTKAGEANTVWGHDYASGLTHSLRRGARWVTSNPCKIQLFKKDFPEYYQELVAEIKRENAGADASVMAAQMFTKVCAISARALYPIFEATNHEYGFVCLQVDPRDIKNTEAMINQAKFWREAMKKELGVEVPNIVIKLPAVEAAVPAAEALLAENFKLCMTLNFTVTQHLNFAKVLCKGNQSEYLVLMAGQLDDQIAKELESKGVADAKLIARHGSEAVMRKSYKLLKEAGYTNLSIMTAAVRGPWHIQNSMAPVDGAPVLITTVTGKINEFDADPTPIASVMDQPVEEKYLDVLKTSDVFNKAICTPDEGLLTLDNLYDYPPFVAFFNQFTAAYQEIEDDFK
ncbi:MAG: transaldolase family protein [Lachnospiraceae bacterium]|nr:transaldolase family protein [Lachnospiraceae bacterium]